ncbi:hypothetical protein F2P81_007940 [Scophthalmus maximus]|uniref:Fibrinogen-like protein 1 n=1 Tax=Scophthalmus maximus TaxID=52904 RepID=A0A6A4T3K9_SCOMX|nr:hypothetical protein F2P81_007940 [Scophthalmus maximus]
MMLNRMIQSCHSGRSHYKPKERQVKLWPGGGTLRATRGRQTQSPEGDSQLTQDNGGNYSLRIHLEDFEGGQRYAEYKNFRVADEKDHYRLAFGAYAGTAGDALSGSFQVGVSEWASHQGMKFSTYDRDNDNYKGNCAQEDEGGWWFNKCHSANLNGLYYPSGHYSAVTDNGVVWYTWRGWWYSLKTSVMKLRPTDFKIDPADDPNAVNRGPPS